MLDQSREIETALQRLKAFKSSQVYQSPKGLHLAAHETREDLDQILRIANKFNEWNFYLKRLEGEGVDLSAIEKLTALIPELGNLYRTLTGITESNPPSISLEATQDWQNPAIQEWICLWKLSDSGVCWLREDGNPSPISMIDLSEIAREGLYAFPVGLSPIAHTTPKPLEKDNVYLQAVCPH
jgi:hypothetical protein